MAGTTTLTLNLEEGLLEQAKRHAKRHGVSLPRLVESFLLSLAREEQAPQPTEPIDGLSQILGQLSQLQALCGEPMAARYASKLLQSMRAFRDRAEHDPLVDVVMALYDALAFEDNWTHYTREQYDGAHKLLEQLSGHRHLSEDDAEKAICALEDLGFDTTPFNMKVAAERS